MKYKIKNLKEKKSIVIAFIIGVILASSIAVYAAVSASQITYKNDKTVEYALNDLYDKTSPTLLWTNSDTTSNFAAQTISLDLSNYKYIVVVTKVATNADYTPRTMGITKITDTAPTYPQTVGGTGGSNYRTFYATSTGVTFGGASSGNKYVIPLYIYGLKNDFGFNFSE